MMGSAKHDTSTTAAAPTALPKWDAQTTADRFTSLRSSLQFALVDSSTSLLPNNNNSNSSNAGSNSNNSNKGGSPFSPTRASATLNNAHSATMNRSTTTTTSTAFGRSISTSAIPQQHHGDNNNDATYGRSLTTSGDGGNVSDGGGLPKPLLGRISISYQNRSNTQTTTSSAIGGDNSVNNNANDHDIQEELIDPPTSNNTAKMKSSSASSASSAAVVGNKSAERSVDNNNNSELSPFINSNNNIDFNNNFNNIFNNGNNSHQYHVNAIRTLLFNAPFNTNTPFQSPNSNINNSNNNYVYLLPRLYIRKWCNWTRCNIVMGCVDDWLVNVVSLLDSGGGGGVGGGRNDGADSSNEDDRVRGALLSQFELPHHALQTLAELSIISDQYQLYTDDDINHDNDGGGYNNDERNSSDGTTNSSNTNAANKQNESNTEKNDKNELEWKCWLEKIQHCWMDWISEITKRGLISFNYRSNSSSSSSNSVRHDEKKEENDDEGIILQQASQLFREMLSTSSYQIELCDPGPIDARLVTRKDKPLQLRRNVSLLIRGSNNNTLNQLTVQQEMNDECVMEYLTSLEVNESPHLAVCPVPTSFYELLRQTLGVICEDGRTVSFQPSATNNGGSGGGNGNGGDGGNMSSLLYHDQWQVETPVSSPPGNASVRKNIDIQYPSSSSSSSAGGGSSMSSPQQHQFTEKKQMAARPIEFRRRLLRTTAPPSSNSIASKGSSGGKKDSYASLSKEAKQSKRDNDKQSSSNGDNGNVGTINYSVEVHPVEFHYAIIDGAASSSSSNNNALRHNQEGMALASRASFAKDVLHELERAASPDRSSACVRIWMKNQPVGKGRGSATKNGDEYELIDVDSLAISPPKTRSSPKPKSRAGGNKSSDKLLTVGEWLKIDDLLQSSHHHHHQSNHPVVVELLIEIRSSPTSRWIREGFELENRLQVGDFVDAQDSARQWYEAIVREVTPDTIKVHYFGWGSKWDTILPRRRGNADGKLKNKLPPAPLWSKTSRWRDEIKVGDEVEVRESSSLVQRPKWHRAIVLRLGKETDAPRDLVGGAELEALEDNGNGKKVPLLLLKSKRQVLVEVPQERMNCPTPIPTVRSMTDDGLPVATPPFIRWVNLYSEEICKAHTHISTEKQQSDAPATASYVMESKRDLVEVMKPYNNIHGSGFVRESLRGMPIASGTVGLHNLGNSCYMNSILQCLNHIKPITGYFLKGDYLKEINKNNPLGSGGRISTAYASFLNDVWGNDYSILAPRLLKQTVGSFSPQFNNNFQHDSQEFCQFLMDGLHEDLNRVKNKPYVEQMEAFGMEDRKAAEESWRNHLKRHDSVFVDYTQGMHRSHLTCPGCGRESVKFDVFSSISLPLVPPKSGSSSIPLKDCLDQFAAGEQLDEHNAWYCSNCKKHVCALKLITLWNTPDILVLHLKRFTFEKCPDVDGRILRRKIEDTVNFPIDRLDMSEYVRGPIDPEAPPIYKLFGVSEHTGTTANSGHYTATVRNSEDGNWYRYNDSNVGFTSGDAAITGGAYLLFYQRIKGSLRWAGMEKELSGAPMLDADGFQEVIGKKKKNRR